MLFEIQVLYHISAYFEGSSSYLRYFAKMVFVVFNGENKVCGKCTQTSWIVKIKIIFLSDYLLFIAYIIDLLPSTIKYYVCFSTEKCGGLHAMHSTPTTTLWPVSKTVPNNNRLLSEPVLSRAIQEDLSAAKEINSGANCIRCTSLEA